MVVVVMGRSGVARGMETNRVGGGREEVSKHAKEAKEEEGKAKEKKERKGAFPSLRLPDGSKLFTRL